MKIKPNQSFTAYIQQTARLLRKEAGKMGPRKVGSPSNPSLASKIDHIAQLLRDYK